MWDSLPLEVVVGHWLSGRKGAEAHQWLLMIVLWHLLLEAVCLCILATWGRGKKRVAFFFTPPQQTVQFVYFI